MWPAFPTSDYYGGSVPSQGQQPTAGLPATGLAGQWEGRPREGSRVHHAPVGGGGAQLFPCSLATSTPQPFLVASGPADATPTTESPTQPLGVRALLAGPYPPGWSRGNRLRGFDHWFTLCCTFPPCLPSPSRLAVPTRLVVVGAAPTLPCASRIRLPPAPTGLLRQASGGPFHPTRCHGASRRTATSVQSPPARMPWTRVSSLAPGWAPAEPSRQTSSSAASRMPSRSARVAGSSSPALAIAWVSSKQGSSSSRLRVAWDAGIEKVLSMACDNGPQTSVSSQLRGPFSCPDHAAT